MNEPINIHEATTQLSQLLSRVALGEEITISDRGVPVAKLVPYTLPKQQKRVPGRLADQIQIADDFNELDEETASLFYGEE